MLDEDIDSIDIDDERILFIQQLVEANLGLVHCIAKRMYRADSGLDYYDFVHQGVLGLAEAAARFDPKNGAAFSGFAGIAITRYILRLIDGEYSTYRIPEREQIMGRNFQRYGRIFMKKNGRLPSLAECARYFELSIAEAAELMNGKRPPIFLDQSGGFSSPHHDRVPDQGGSNPLLDYERARRNAQCRLVLAEILEPGELQLILRYHGEESLRSMAPELGITPRAVTKRYQRALERVRESPHIRTLEDLL